MSKYGSFGKHYEKQPKKIKMIIKKEPNNSASSVEMNSEELAEYQEFVKFKKFQAFEKR